MLELCVQGQLQLLIQAPADRSLNFPLREPLIPLLDNEQLFQQKERVEGYVTDSTSNMSLKADEFDHVC